QERSRNAPSPTAEIRKTAAIRAATAGRRLAHTQSRFKGDLNSGPDGRPAKNFSRSIARAAASGYRLSGSLCKHFKQMLSTSRGTLLFSLRGGTGVVYRTFATISNVSPSKGGRPASSSYRIAPSP